jgi:phage I-like protein
METINELLKALDNKVPASIAKRLDGLQKLNEKLRTAKSEHEANPTEESQESLDEVLEFLQDTEEDLIEDLSELVDKKRKEQAIARQKALKEQEQKANLEKAELGKKKETEGKSGIRWGSLILGGILLVATGGAIKYFGNKK